MARAQLFNRPAIPCSIPSPSLRMDTTAGYCIGTRANNSNLRPQPIRNAAGDLRRGLVGNRKYRADIDLAKHVAVGAVGAGRPEHEVGVPDHRQVASRNIQQ